MSNSILKESVAVGALSAVTASLINVGTTWAPAGVLGFTTNAVAKSLGGGFGGLCAGVIAGTMVTKFIADPKLDVYKAVCLTGWTIATEVALNIFCGCNRRR